MCNFRELIKLQCLLTPYFFCHINIIEFRFQIKSFGGFMLKNIVYAVVSMCIFALALVISAILREIIV